MALCKQRDRNPLVIIALTMVFIAGVSILPLTAMATADSNPHPSGSGEPTVKVYLEGQPLSFDVSPQIINGRVMAPVRALFEAMGATLYWEDSTMTITAVKGSTTVICQIGNTAATINGDPATLDSPPLVLEGRTLAPLRFVAEAFGDYVIWDEAENAAYISSIPFPGQTPLPSQSSPRTFALIYNGPVAAEEAPEAVAAVVKKYGLQVVYISDISRLPNLLDGAAVFIVGGTEDDLEPLYEEFTPEIKEALNLYLQDGGCYLGICGGAFLASTGWDDWNGFVPMLGLVPAKSADYLDSDSPRIIPVRWLGTEYQMYYQGGPVLEPQGQDDLQIVAYYEDGEIAALISPFGQGRVAVCGPHPEAPRSWSEEAIHGERWSSSTFLLEDLLAELLSRQNAGKASTITVGNQ